MSANREPFIQQGQVDLVVATYTINDERKKKVNFAGPYYIAGQDLLVPTDSTITGPESLGRQEGLLGRPARRRPSGSRPSYKDAQLQQFDVVLQVRRRRWPAARSTRSPPTTSSSPGYAAQEQYAGKFKVVGKPFSEEPYGIGLKKDDKAGCNKINEILKAAATDGSYKAAWDATLGKSGKPAPELDASKLTNCA